MKKTKKLLAAVLGMAVMAAAMPVSASAAWNYGNGSWRWEENGQAAVGWKYINQKWYYFQETGVMATGWRRVNGKWYFMDESGAMATGWVEVNGLRYYMDESGAMESGFFQVDGEQYFAAPSGAMQTGVVEIDGQVYLFGEEGAMQTGRQVINGKTYYFSRLGGGEAVGRKPQASVAFRQSGDGSVAPSAPTVQPPYNQPSVTVPSAPVEDEEEDEEEELVPVAITGVDEPTADGVGGPETNVGKYTVSHDGNLITITETEALQSFGSASPEQGTAKWVGVLITTDVEITALKYNGSPLGEGDISDATSVGASGRNTFVLWLKAEQLGEENRVFRLSSEGRGELEVTVEFAGLEE